MKNLTFEQCKNLKEWGFPQNTDHYWVEPNRSNIDWHISTYKGIGEFYSIPNLEELIEWLGNKFGMLERDFDGSYWAYDSPSRDIAVDGITATEAVYNLCELLQEPNKLTSGS